MDNLSDLERVARIDRYLNGSLSAEETQAFEAALAHDQQLRQEYEDIAVTRTLAQDYGLRDEIRVIRQAMHQEARGEMTPEPTTKAPTRSPTSAPEPPKVRPRWRPPTYAGRIAAGVSILLIGFLALQFATLSSDDLYAEKVVFYQLSASRSAETSEATAESRLEQQYQSRRFGEVTATYEQMSDPSLMAVFLAGQAYLQAGQTDSAIEAFRKIVTIDERQGINRFEEDAEYYLALSYLRADRPAEALPLLEAINANSEHSYHSSVSGYYLWKVKLLNSIQ